MMEKYNPQIEPNKQIWLNTSEDERIDMVREYHKKNDDLEDDALTIHSAIHVIVENQLAMGIELLPETITKLIRQGLERHEAIHAVGAIISENIFDLVRGNKSEFSPKQYRNKLDKITAKRWRKGQY